MECEKTLISLSSSSISFNKRRNIGAISILLVDDDTTCLSIVAAILKSFNYEVVTVKHANEALLTLRVRRGLFDLVVTDLHMPDIDGFELQKRIHQEFQLPVVFMSVDGEKSVILKGLQSGAAFFIVKPVSPDNLKNLWQFAVTNRKMSTNTDELVGIGATPENSPSAEDSEARMQASEEEIITGSDKRDSKKPRAAPRRAKISWTKELHDKFLEAIRFIGYHRAIPKAITEFMNVPGLTRDHVASHLQKYRLFLKRATEERNKPSGSTSGSGQAFGLHQQKMTAFVDDNGKPFQLQSPVSLTNPPHNSSASQFGASILRPMNYPSHLKATLTKGTEPFKGYQANFSSIGSSSSSVGLRNCLKHDQTGPKPQYFNNASMLSNSVSDQGTGNVTPRLTQGTQPFYGNQANFLSTGSSSLSVGLMNGVNRVQTGVAAHNVLANPMSSAKPSADGLVTQNRKLKKASMLSSSVGDQGTTNATQRVTEGAKPYEGNIANFSSIGTSSSPDSIMNDVNILEKNPMSSAKRNASNDGLMTRKRRLNSDQGTSSVTPRLTEAKKPFYGNQAKFSSTASNSPLVGLNNNASDDGLVTQNRKLKTATVLSNSVVDQGTSYITPRVIEGAKPFNGNIVELSSIGTNSSPDGFIDDVNQAQTGPALQYFNNILENPSFSSKPNRRLNNNQGTSNITPRFSNMINSDPLLQQTSAPKSSSRFTTRAPHNILRNMEESSFVAPRTTNLVQEENRPTRQLPPVPARYNSSRNREKSTPSFADSVEEPGRGILSLPLTSTPRTGSRNSGENSSVAPACVDLIQEARLKRPMPPISALQNMNGHTEESPQNNTLMLEDGNSNFLDLIDFDDPTQGLGDMEDLMSIFTSNPIRVEDYESLNKLLFEEEETSNRLQNERR